MYLKPSTGEQWPGLRNYHQRACACMHNSTPWVAVRYRALAASREWIMRSQTTGLVARMSRRPPDSLLGDKSATFISITPRVYTSSRRRPTAPTASPAWPSIASRQPTFHEVIKTSRLMCVQGREAMRDRAAASHDQRATVLGRHISAQWECRASYCCCFGRGNVSCLSSWCYTGVVITRILSLLRAFHVIRDLHHNRHPCPKQWVAIPICPAAQRSYLG